MNYHLSWIAVRGLDRASVLAALGLIEAPAGDEPTYFHHSVADLPDGWIVILAEDFMYPTPDRMAALSVGGTALACSMDERSMYSVIRGYTDGKALWSIDHDGGGKGVYHLDVGGTPPSEYALVRDRLKAQQDAEGGDDAGVDYLFDAPLELSLVLCGYKFDPLRDDGPEFRLLDTIKPKRGGLFGKLFGKR